MAHNLKYTPEWTTKKNNIFLEEFFTGVDTKIYIDNMEADFIASLSYALNENVNPLYGYNSYTYDDITIGNRIVTGNILIPIKNYDTLITDFTKDGHSHETHVLQSSEAWMPDKTWHDKPYWAENYKDPEDYEEEEKEDDSILPKVKTIRRTRNNISKPPETGGSNPSPPPTPPPIIEEEELGDDSLTDGEVGVSINRKPKFIGGRTPYFNEWYSKEESTVRFIKGRLRDNYKDILIKVANRPSILLKTVVFRSQTTQLSANDEPLYESLEFVARDVIILDGENFDKGKPETDTDTDTPTTGGGGGGGGGGGNHDIIL